MDKTAKRLSNVIIRKFKIEDYNDILSLWEEAELPYKPLGRDKKVIIEREIKEPTSVFLVAEIGGKLIGSLLGTHDGRKGWINRLAVSKDFQKIGIAKMLVEEAEKIFSELGIWIFACCIEDWNTESKVVFEKFGYKEHRDIIYYTKRKYHEI